MYENKNHSANDRKIFRLRDEIKEEEERLEDLLKEIDAFKKKRWESSERLRTLKQLLRQVELS